MCKKDAESNIAPIDLYYYSYFPTSLPPDLHADAARKQIILSFRFHNHSPMLLWEALVLDYDYNIYVFSNIGALEN